MSDRPSSKLVPLSSELEPEVRAFAELLREYLDMMAMSLRAASRECHLDQGAISRFLSGVRVPNWSFVEQYLGVAAQQRGRELSREEQAQARDLHASALQVRHKSKWKIERLERELEEAREEQRHSAMRERLVTRELEARDEEIRLLEERIRDIQAQSRMLERSDHAETRLAIEHNEADYDEIVKERDELRRDRDELKIELNQVRADKETAEQRYSQIARDLEDAKAKLAAVETSEDSLQREDDPEAETAGSGTHATIRPDAILTARQKKALDRVLDQKTLQINAILVYLLSLLLSVYFGWVYSAVTSSHMLRQSTPWGLLVPVLLAFAATRTRRPMGSWAKQLIAAALITAACFFLGTTFSVP